MSTVYWQACKHIINEALLLLPWLGAMLPLCGDGSMLRWPVVHNEQL